MVGDALAGMHALQALSDEVCLLSAMCCLYWIHRQLCNVSALRLHTASAGCLLCSFHSALLCPALLLLALLA